ncbi:hypothetical protein H8788_14380 [Parabacteroides faecis]|uniref:hypothetical protein n=1 Tax=Parabacteroides TaxID=375288 RepID=UPI0011C36AC3|nr:MULTISPECIES: hypothetical protein [Parabacteroides]MBC8618929.1 hypothetical protein [Parabacteroides faecis]
MNDLSQKAILFLLLIGAVIAFAISGAEDCNQETIEVIGAMPDEVYQEIVNDLGPGCTNQEVVAEYRDNRMYYDSIIAVK